MSTKYLNSDNILKKVYDPSTETLRTTAVASFVGGSVDISISDLTDSIKIGDGSGVYLNINPDGSINANVEVDAADGDNIGLKVQTRNLSPDDSQYTKRVTAKTGTTNTDTTSIDISLHDHQGNEFTETNQFPTNSSIRDGNDSSKKAKVSNNKDLSTSDIINTQGIYGTITVGTTVIELKIGGTVLVDRKLATLDNTSNNTIFWGYDNTLSTINFAGRIFKDQQASWAVGESISIFLVASSAGNDVHISEGA